MGTIVPEFYSQKCVCILKISSLFYKKKENSTFCLFFNKGNEIDFEKVLTKKLKKLEVEGKSMINKGMKNDSKIDSFLSIRRTSILFLESSEQDCSNKHAVKLFHILSK